MTCTTDQVKETMTAFCAPKDGTCEEMLPGLFGTIKGPDQSKTDFCAILKGYDPAEDGQSLAMSLHEAWIKRTRGRSGGFLCGDTCVDEAVTAYCTPFKCTAETIAGLLKGAGVATNK